MASEQDSASKLKSVSELNKGQGVSFVVNDDYSNFRGHRAVLVGLHEVRQLVPMLPLVLARLDDEWRLMGITGFAQTRNLLIGQQGQWAGFYIPERWRFSPLKLIPGEDAPALGYSDHSLRLFPGGQDTLIDADGNTTERYENIRQRLLVHVRSRQMVQVAAEALLVKGLLMEVPEEGPLRIPGLGNVYQCNMQDFPELDVESLQALKDCGGLNLAFAMHFANVNVKKFQRMLRGRQAAQVDEDVVDALADVEEFSFNFDD